MCSAVQMAVELQKVYLLRPGENDARIYGTPYAFIDGSIWPNLTGNFVSVNLLSCGFVSV